MAAPTKTGEGRRGLDLPRRDLFLWICAILFFNQVLAAVNQAPSTSPGQILSDLAAASVFQIMAWYAIFRLLASSDPRQVAQMRDLLVALALCVPVVPPDNPNHQVRCARSRHLQLDPWPRRPQPARGGSRARCARGPAVLGAYCL